MISASSRRLSVFKAVVDAGGFSLAAARLGIAQPSVGAHIKALEDQVGQPLFHRVRGSRPMMTKAGEALYAYAVDVLKRSAEATSTLTDLRQLDSGEVSLALHRDVAPRLLATHLARFTAEFSTIRMVTRTGTIEDIIGLAHERIVHLAFIIADGPIPGLQSEVLTHYPIYLVVAPSHPLAKQKNVTAEDVMKYPFFTGLKHSRYMQVLGTILKEAGIEGFEVSMEVQDSVSMKEMLRHGKGIAAFASCILDHEIASGSLVPLRLTTRLRDFELRCIYRSPLPQAAQKFLTYIRAQIDPKPPRDKSQ